MRWAGHVARMREKRNMYRLLVRKPQGKRPPGRPRCRWMDYIKMDLLETGLNVVRFEVFTAVTMKNGVFWVVTPCGSCKNRRFGFRRQVAVAQSV
jgi:hypothetical protein